MNRTRDLANPPRVPGRRRPGHRAWPLVLAPLLAVAGCGTQVQADEDEVDAVVAAAALPDVEETERGFAHPVEGAARRDPAPADGEAEGLYTVLYSERDAEIRARRDGHVRSLGAEMGDRVAAGQGLASLESDEEAAGVASAEAAVDYARHQEERTRTLAEGDLTTRVELEEATYRLRAAVAAHQDAIARLERTRVRAPFGGVVTRRFVRLGSYVEEGDPLFRVTALRPLRALVRVPESAAAAVEPGRRMILEALDGTRVFGSVARVAPAVDPASGTVDVLIDVADPGPLRPGSSVRVFPGAAAPAGAASTDGG